MNINIECQENDYGLKTAAAPVFFAFRAQIRHQISGRIRLKVPAAKGDAQLLEQIKASLAALPEVRSVEARALTGSLLVLYCPEERRGFLDGVGKILKLESEGAAENDARRTVAGRALFAAGVAGVLLPIVPGTPLLLAGVAALGPSDPMVARAIAWTKKVRPYFRALRDSVRTLHADSAGRLSIR